MRFDDRQLELLLLQGESDHVERKESCAGRAPTAIREAICAFANDLPGHNEAGVVFVGVNDSGVPTGSMITDDLLRTLADMKTDGNILPPPTLTVETRRIAGADIAVVTVLPSDSPPVRYRGTIHIRIGSRKGIATAQDERILNEKRRHGDRPFDIQRVPSSALKDLQIRSFEDEYLPRAVAPEVLEENDRTLHERLAATKMIASSDDPCATVLGLLVLGKRPRDFLPGAYLQFLRIDGADLADPVIDSDEIDGTISDSLRRLDEKLRSHNRVTMDFLQGDREKRAELYPLAALQQFARNAVMHRTYEATNSPTRLYWFKDQIEIMSPGGPFGIVTSANFGQPGLTDYRNPNLAEAMRVLGYVQRYGAGIAAARRLLASAGHPEPRFEVTESAVLVIVEGIKS